MSDDVEMVAAFVPSMMDRSKAEAGLPGAVFVASAQQLTLVDAEVFVIDLMAEGVGEVLPDLCATGRVIGYARHTEEQLLEAARTTGVDALARSVFFKRLADGTVLDRA